MSAEKDHSVDIPEYVMAELQEIMSMVTDDEGVEIINLGDIDSTVEEMEMMALMHYLRKGLPLHEAERKAKEIVKEQIEIEKLFEEDRKFEFKA